MINWSKEEMTEAAKSFFGSPATRWAVAITIQCVVAIWLGSSAWSAVNYRVDANEKAIATKVDTAVYENGRQRERELRMELVSRLDRIETKLDRVIEGR